MQPNNIFGCVVVSTYTNLEGVSGLLTPSNSMVSTPYEDYRARTLTIATAEALSSLKNHIE